MIMKILITGATGYIGRELAKSLSGEHEICAINPNCRAKGE
jgi:nucleoside-diphosphate-sugar epimerase